VTVELERAVSGDHARFKTRIAHKTKSAEEVAERMFQALKMIDEESRTSPNPKDHTDYATRFPLARCQRIVEESLKQAKIKSGRVTDDNLQRFLQALGTLRRKKAKRVVYKMNPKALVTLNTRDRQADSCSAAELRRGAKTVFYGPGSESILFGDILISDEVFTEVATMGDDLPGAIQTREADWIRSIEIENMSSLSGKSMEDFSRRGFELINGSLIKASFL